VPRREREQVARDLNRSTPPQMSPPPAMPSSRFDERWGSKARNGITCSWVSVYPADGFAQLGYATLLASTQAGCGASDH
jgi:hypothetical protein